MKAIKATVLTLLTAVGLSSCIVAVPARGPGYYRGGPRFHGPRPHYHPHYHGGGSRYYRR